jgi:hypothetical protein
MCEDSVDISQATRAESLGWIVGGVALAALVSKSGVIGVATAVSLSYAVTFIIVSMYAKRPGVRDHDFWYPHPATTCEAGQHCFQQCGGGNSAEARAAVEDEPEEVTLSVRGLSRSLG